MMTEDNKKIDEMYNIRSNIRSLYLNNNTTNYEASLISELMNNYSNIVSNVFVSFKTFSVIVSINSATEDDRNNIINTVINNIRNTILNLSNDKSICNYVNNNNQIVDSFYVGDSIKFIL